MTDRDRFLHLFRPPYYELQPLRSADELPRREFDIPGSAIIWDLASESSRDIAPDLARRRGGLALIMVLPPSGQLTRPGEILHLVETTRPHSILPHSEDLELNELREILSRPPSEFALEVMDYLMWRGIRPDLETRRLVRRTLELSAEIKSVGALARALYLSRRALGRRLRGRGLPVPSHLLHFGRVLRAAIRLQSSEGSLFTVGAEFGYPDGFALSNQMHRLVGVRPSFVRKHLGWEWIVEKWIRKETQEGGFEARAFGRAVRRENPMVFRRRAPVRPLKVAEPQPVATDRRPKPTGEPPAESNDS